MSPHHGRRRTALLALSAAALSVAASAALETPQGGDKPPNFVVIFADDMGYGDMSCTGNPTILTPNLDKLAAEGMRFTQWYSGFHVCSPSRASMLTGRLPIRSGTAGAGWTGGVFRNDAVGGLPENETTFAELLRDRGYATMAIGKWHVGQQEKFLPTNQGFDEYFGIPYSVDMGASAWDEDGGFGSKVSLPLMENTTIIEQPVNLNTLDSRYVEKASGFIKRNVAAEKPFALYLAWSHVHVPDYASPKFCNSSARGRFGDAMQEMDAAIGSVMQVLKEQGADESTLVFFTSDNGPWLIMRLSGGSSGPFFEGKSTTWEGGIREPAIVRWPGKIPAGVVSTELAATYDIFSTVVTLAGAKIPDDRAVDGKDLSGLLLRGERSPHRCLFHYKGTPSTGLPPREDDPEPGLWAIRCGAYKAHFVTSCAVMQQFGDSRCSAGAVAFPPPSLSPLEACRRERSAGMLAECEERLRSGTAPVVRSPPLLYNVEHDLGEMYPIDPKSDEYKKAMAEIWRAKREHEATLTPVTNQMALGGNESLSVCCDPHSQQKHPTLPRCTCNSENYEVFVCKPMGPVQRGEVSAQDDATSVFA